MADGRDRQPVLDEAEAIVARMRKLSGSGDPVELSSIDLEFHRAVALHSGNLLAAQIWEGLAKHMLIVFCRDWATASDRTGEVRLHETLVEFLRKGALKDIPRALTSHFSDPATRSGAATR